MRSCNIHLKAISLEMLKISILDMSLKITYLRLQPHLPRANELTGSMSHTQWNLSITQSIITWYSMMMINGGYIYRIMNSQNTLQTSSSWVSYGRLECNWLEPWWHHEIGLPSVIKENTRSSGGASREITCWHQAEDSDAWCQQVISRLAPPDERVFSFYTVLTYGINNKWCQ